MSIYSPGLLRPSPPGWLEDICQKLQESDRSLVTLDLSHPRIDDVFARLVADALCENQIVTTVILSCFAIVDDGAHHMGKALMKHRKLRKIQLRDLRNQREINIFFDLLAEHGHIEEVSLRHTQICSRSVGSIIRFIHNHSKLSELRIVDSQIDETSQKELFQGIKGHPSLKRVYLINVGISSTTSTFVAEMLQEVCIEELHLCENDIEDEGTSVLAASLVKNTNLRLLDLRSNGISDQAALSLQGMLMSSTGLSTLHMSNNDIGDLGAAALSRGLSHPTCVVQDLDLGQNCVGATGGLALSKMLRSNKSLTSLNLSFNNIGNEGATALTSALLRNRTLRCLRLRRCGISNQGAQGISQHLPRMHGLKELILAKNEITTEGSMALLNGIRNNVEIEYLHVHDTLSEPVSKEIVHWIRLNKAGRRIFRKTNAVQSALWPNVYGRLSSNYDMLYHFIKEKPDIMDKDAERASQLSRKRKHS